MLVQETSDYDVFQILNCNRKLHKSNLKKLNISIQQANLLKSRPILIDKEFNVIDGQHRLEVAKQLGIPISYQVHESSDLKDIILLNNNVKSWCISDYLNYYCKVPGYPDYQFLNNFVEENKLDVNIALKILNVSRNTGFYKDFKEGLYTFPNNVEYNNAILKKLMLDETVDFIKKKTSGNKIYLSRVTFYGALVEFFSNKSFSYEVFMKKLQYKIDFMHPCSKKEEYLKVLKDIYNWKNHSPLEIK